MFSFFKDLKRMGTNITQILALAESIDSNLNQCIINKQGVQLTEKTGGDLIKQVVVNNDITFRIKVHSPESDIHISACIEKNGCWEPFESTIFAKFCAISNIVLDLGANIGWYSLVAAMSNSKKKVIAFEPDGNNFTLLKENCLLNGCTHRVVLENKAVSDQDAEALLYLDKVNLGDHRVFYDGVDRDIAIIHTVTLEEYSKSWTEFPDIVKIDTQGHEGLIFKGTWNLLKNGWLPTFFLEFWPREIKKTGESPVEMLEHFETLGYKIFAINHRELRLETISSAVYKELDETFFDSGDVVFLDLLCIYEGNKSHLQILDDFSVIPYSHFCS